MTQKDNGTEADHLYAGVAGLIKAERGILAALRDEVRATIVRIKAMEKAHKLLVSNGTKPAQQRQPRAEKKPTRQTGVKASLLQALAESSKPMDLGALAVAGYGKDTEVHRTRVSAFLGKEVGKQVRRVSKGLYAAKKGSTK